ncbi:hypothetical protein [Siminovitchia sp. 179-K 8D1 HS]|uniref:hypothetical protein n=1 Tax=Siminovitchia sp. 179-K 8D1 HS TaxID=3142385 RepID=UPI0039A1E2C9
MDQKKDQFLPDTEHEGKDQSFLDIDRMVNEGLAGGTVIMRKDGANIEQTIDLFPEEPLKKQ